ncbi:MAG: hypothetical protein JM58_17895 [Peptococcaceae bacterium BICA1-8]|nr:MAG: hypothetical protein JM58_17895 [Peptococcaceae bacterium BICA1-8]
MLPAQCVNGIQITAESQTECPNTPLPILGLTDGLIAKIPIILSRFTVQIHMDSIIILPESVLEIKMIHKNIIITQSILAQNSNILFIRGFIKNNISYAAVGCWNSPKGICSDIRHCTFHIPFSCTTAIIYNGAEPLPLYTNTIQEFEYLYREELDPTFTEKDKLLSADFSEYNQISMEFFNERPYCELESSRIVDFNEFLDCTPPDKDLTLTRRQFKKIEEKTVLFLTFKLLQDQQVAIPRF